MTRTTISTNNKRKRNEQHKLRMLSRQEKRKKIDRHTHHKTGHELSVNLATIGAISTLLLSVATIVVYHHVSMLSGQYEEQQKESIKRKKAKLSAAARNRSPRQRMSWQEFSNSLSDFQFRRMFRMNRACFCALCDKIRAATSERKFKSEAYLAKVAGEGWTTPRGRMYQAHLRTSGGYISGEVRLALALRLMAGGSYLDLSALYRLDQTYVFPLFHKTLRDFICQDKVIKIDLYNNLKDKPGMRNAARKFAFCSRRSAISGCLGALDGWLVRIKCPDRKRDKILNPGEFYCRKGFYALNVQVISDREKRVRWRSIISRGGEHDSTAFKNSRLYKHLEKNYQRLADLGFYFIGDSAYSLRPFLITPNDNARLGSPEDDFNFFHSASRIIVECLFGEIDGRWGIFWRPLMFSLEHNIQVIDAAFRLHNFIVDYSIDNGLRRNLQSLMDRCEHDDSLIFSINNPNEPMGPVGDNVNDDTAAIGRPTLVESQLREEGIRARQRIQDTIFREGLRRPTVNWYRDQFNRVRQT